VEDMKIKLANSVVDPEILNLSTSNGGLGETMLNRIKKTTNKDINTENIVDILSETTVVSHIHEIDRAADEIAELISQHVNIRIDDSSSTVVSFKPVIGSVTSST
jgi:Flp pilus assembly CpaF family ATPase